MRTVESSAAPGWLDVEAAVESFERAYAEGGSADPAEYCPPVGSPLHVPVAAELVRADLEFALRDDRPTRLGDYRAAFPALFADPTALSGVAFEEYRLRCQAGEGVDPEEYRRQFGVEPARWPVSSSAPGWANGPARGPVPPDDFPEAGAEVAGFRLAGELGRGAFARVYLAEQSDLAGRYVALKLSTRLAAEAQTLARLQHTNIVPIYSVHKAGAFTAVCMPYLGAATLADVLDGLRGRPSVPCSAGGLVSTVLDRCGESTRLIGAARPAAPTVDRPGLLESLKHKTHVEAVLWIGAELADGLAHAHDRGIIHRDLKPANVLLSDEGRPLLLDFNLAGDERRAGAEGRLIGGTPLYMAPEQLAAVAGEPLTVDARSDVYSLGLMLYELLAGRLPDAAPPGVGQDRLVQLRTARSVAPPPARDANPAITPATDAIVARCLAPDPAHRYPSARHLREDLLAQLDNRPLRHVREPSWRERAQKAVRRNPWIRSAPFVAGVVAAVAAIGFAAYAYRTRQFEQAAAAENYRAFADDVGLARLRLVAPDPDPAQRSAGAAAAREALGRFALPGDDNWADAPRFARLTPEQQTRVRSQAAELLVHLARLDVLRAAESAGPGRSPALAQAAEWCALAERVAPDEPGRWMARGYAGWVGELATGRDATPPVTPGSPALRAADLIARGEYRRANELLRGPEFESVREPGYYAMLGRCAAELGDGRQAVADYTTAIALAGAEDYWLHLGRGNAALRAKDFRAAAADFDAAIRLRPDYAAAYRDRSLARLGAGDPAGAVADLNESARLEPGHTRVCFMRARAHARAGDSAAAQRDAAEGLSKTPADELSWIARAQARRKRDPAGALADLDQALATNARSPHALLTRASILSEELNRPGDAVAALDRLIAVQPDNVNARAGRGVLLARQGKRDAAHTDAVAALAISRAPFTRYQVAGVYALTSKTHPKDRAEALRLLASALRDKEGLAHEPTDHDLDPLRDDPEFARLVEAAKALEAAARGKK